MTVRLHYPTFLPGVFASLLLCLFAIAAHGQILDELQYSRLNTAAYYNYSQKGDVTIHVHVWGAFRFPGLYEIPRGTTVSEVISLAGGPLFPERERRSMRLVSLKVHRKDLDGFTRNVVFQDDMENEIVVSENDISLQEQDVLGAEVVVRRTFSFRDLFPIISAAATLALLVDRINTN